MKKVVSSMLVNLKKKPYCLSDKQIAWVESKIASLSLDEKLMQLFTCLTAGKDETYLSHLAKSQKPGGIRYNPMGKADVLAHNSTLQNNADTPFLIAANTEEGGNGACKEGTNVGCGTKIGSTGDPNYAYLCGKISAKEAKQVGVNTLFAPIVDIHHDFHNPIIAYKCFSNDPEDVAKFSLAFVKGVMEEGLLPCPKHFPGDGFDERDQHLAPSMNPLSCEEWDNAFGKVYSTLIEAGVPMIMAGHIQLPSYQKHFSPETEKYLPATLSKEIVDGLLKGKLGFNGVVTSDATHMVGLTCAGKREEFLPKMIASGIDMILFYNDFEEDMEFMRRGYAEGVISDERLNDALRRILGLKAKLGYDVHPAIEETNLDLIGCPEHQKVAAEVADKGIVLVKKEAGVLPIDKTKVKKILLVLQNDPNPFEALMPKGIPTIADIIKKMLDAEGFEVEIFESLMDKAKKLPPPEAFKLIANVYNNKTPISGLTESYDLIIHICDFDSHNTVTRISWKMSKGTPDVPWYVDEVPTIMVSVKNPFHLFDAPMVKTYINCYDKTPITIKSLIDKLVGRSEFKGTSPVDAFCGDLAAKQY